MSRVPVSRFVHVMSGGKFGKGWKESMNKRDTVVIGILNRIKAELQKMADLGVSEPAWQALHDDVLRALTNTPGSTGKKLMDYLEGVAAQANQALQQVLAISQRITDKFEVRNDLLAHMKFLTERIGDNIASTKDPLPQPLKREASITLDAINDELQLLTHLKAFPSEASLDQNITELKRCDHDTVVLDRSTRTKLPTNTSELISQVSANAKANPDSDIGKVCSVLAVFSEDYLETIEMRKIEHQTDFHGLSHEELLSVIAYTSVHGFFNTINAILLGTADLPAKERAAYERTIEICKQALAKLPDYPAQAWPTYRLEDGSKYDWTKQFVVGRNFKNPIFWSTGRTSGYDASGRIKGPRLNITIFGKKSGKDVARMADSQTEGGGEILIPPGTEFKVLDIDRSEVEVVDGKLITPKKATVYITVEEV
jgi:hypothetical protein